MRYTNKIYDVEHTANQAYMTLSDILELVEELRRSALKYYGRIR